MQNDNDRFQETADSADIEQVIDRGNGQTMKFPGYEWQWTNLLKSIKRFIFPIKKAIAHNI